MGKKRILLCNVGTMYHGMQHPCIFRNFLHLFCKER